VGRHGILLPESNETVEQEMKEAFEAFKLINNSASAQLMPDSIYFDYLNLEMVIDTLVSRQRVRGEYLRIIDNLPVNHKMHIIDVSVSNPDIPLNEVFVVVELLNEKEQILKWKHFGFPHGKEDFKISLSFDKTDSDNPVFLKLYIWNESPLHYSFEQMRTTIYQRNEN
jgi:hypothetical protein